VKWCRSCVLPDSRPNLRIEPDGRCNACHSRTLTTGPSKITASTALPGTITRGK